MQFVSRRAFVKGATCASVASIATRSSFAKPESPNTIGLGFSLYGMKSLAIEEALEKCAEIGYDCVELPVQVGWPGDSIKLSLNQRKLISNQLEATGLRLSCLMENLHAVVDDTRHKSNLERMKLAGELGHQLSPEKPPVVETILGGRPAQWDEIKLQIVDRLRDWAKVAEEVKTVVAIKAHVGGAMHRPEHPVWVAEQVNSPCIKCAYDYSHFELRDINMAESVKALVPNSVFIHVKDSRGDAKRVQFLLPGEGDIDYVKLLRLIKENGYTGDVIVEVSGQIHGKTGYDPIAAARKSYDNLAPTFNAAGIQRKPS